MFRQCSDQWSRDDRNIAQDMRLMGVRDAVVRAVMKRSDFFTAVPSTSFILINCGHAIARLPQIASESITILLWEDYWSRQKIFPWNVVNFSLLISKSVTGYLLGCTDAARVSNLSPIKINRPLLFLSVNLWVTIICLYITSFLSAQFSPNSDQETLIFPSRPYISVRRDNSSLA